MERRVRVTIRCLRDDLHIPLPPLEEDIGLVDHELLAEARRLAPVAEEAQERIVAIAAPPVFKLRHGRWRGATWLDREENIFWLLAGAQREEGSKTDPYVQVVSLHSKNSLLPTDDDRLRDQAESGARFLRSLPECLRDNLQKARSQRGSDLRFVCGDLSLRLYVERDGAWEQIWFAVRTVGVSGGGVKQELRDLAFAILEEIVGESEWEYQAAWPSTVLHGCEVVRLGIASTPEGD